MSLSAFYDTLPSFKAYANSSLVYGVSTCVVQTGCATVLGGASLGTAIVTIGLPAGAVGILAVTINTLSISLLKYMNLTTPTTGARANYENIHFGVEACRRAAVWLTVAGLTSFSPVFRIQPLITIITTQAALLSLVFLQGRYVPVSQDWGPGGSPWMDRLGVFVRA